MLNTQTVIHSLQTRQISIPALAMTLHASFQLLKSTSSYLKMLSTLSLIHINFLFVI